MKRRKERKRQPYRGSRAVDRTCRNHGSCTYCQSNRTYKNEKKAFSANEQIEEAEKPDLEAVEFWEYYDFWNRLDLNK